jgi:hypothetical protein
MQPNATVQTNAKDIIVINPSSAAGWIGSVCHFGELYMSDVTSMVAAVSARTLQTQSDIRGLRIMDHGNATGCGFGSDFVTTANFFSYYNAFSQLTGAFCPYNGFAQMQHCLAGRNTPLLLQFAQLWKVPVYGGLWYTNAATGWNMYATETVGKLTGMPKAIPNPFKGFQQWVRVDPNGTITQNVTVP